MAKLLFFYFLVVFPSFILLANCQQGNNTLEADQFLNETQTLVSLNKVFELGFFNLSDSNNEYLGIWYTAPKKTVVWVANGDSPIIGGNGSLHLTPEGVLSLQNGSGYVVWSTNKRSFKGPPEAALLDSGTLIVRDTMTGDVSWQSSYDLSNTLLPGMYLGYITLPNLNQKMQLTSWKNDTDPSPGSYVYMLDHSRLYELVIVYGSTVTYRTGPWTGSHWNGMPQLGEAGLVAFQLNQTDVAAYFYYNSLNPAYIFRLVMNQNGTLSFLRSNLTSDWEEFERIPPANSGQFALCGPNAISQGCVGWFGDLIDTVKLANDQGDNLYMRVAAPPPPPPPPHTPDMNVRKDELMTFEFSTLRSATNNFNPANKLGEGQFGIVYKGVLNDGEEVVVKRLARNSREGIENSKKEVTLLGKLRHPNLVKLLGYCVREEEMLLCYEYIPNRSLDQLLFGNLENQDSPLNWGMRYSILEGISAGLLYLHEDSGHAIIHREIKPSNILLDNNMVPKISDFGLSQLFDQDNLFVKLCRVASCGHMAPELQKKIISTNADVYSFGVLILEIITGQRNSSFPNGLVAHVRIILIS
ncbi:hypothetical protein LUZ61_008853 [Rhynchospora tenuis]|uniref:non-specific serine/threonine protein kinase n=1 Tax=Rhynchospora tenuis TaxID=198213 RepID=A0AAD6EY21_9POAL|nr:hypothetical protein LUZ61_008853 [Rhynchospora tenuis]